MSTKITVAVGPNGEALNSKALRDGSRADRIETESTTKQAKQFVAEEGDKLTQGRDNPDSKYKPSRDPAAFARKKKDKEDGAIADGFCGLRIELFHQQLPLGLKWKNARDAKYMDIKVQGFAPDGSWTDQQTITLNRNLNHEAFVAKPGLNDYDADLVERTRHSSSYAARGESPWPGTRAFFASTWYTLPDVKFAVTYLEQSNDVNPLPGVSNLTEEGWIRAIGDNFAPNFMPFNYAGVIGPLDGSTAFKQWERFTGWIVEDGERNLNFDREGYPTTEENFNVSQNGRTLEDSRLTDRINEHLDPVYELFMLPYTAQKSFLLVTYTDYMIYDDCNFESTCSGTTEFAESADWRIFVSGAGYVRWYTGYLNNIYYKRFRPTYNIPDGWRLQGYDHQTLSFTDGSLVGSKPLPVITEQGSQVIQQVHLYAITDGVVSKVEEVPQELRDAVGKLSTNLKNQPINSTTGRTSSLQNYSEFQATQFYRDPGRADPNPGRVVGNVDGTDNWTMADPGLYMMRDDTLADTVSTFRKYLANQTRSRSMPKAYGFGRLESNNHFDSQYISNTLKGFADDFFFTPAVYAYIKGEGTCSTMYEAQGQGGVEGFEKYADYGGTDRVRFTTVQPESINASHPGPYTDWAYVPLLKDSTHRCWNWGRPDICWDQLHALGFGNDLIGPKPAGPEPEPEPPDE